MTQKIINIGSSPNKGDGDVLRTAFGKINDNFTELYATDTSTKYHLGDDVQFVDIDVDTGMIVIQSGFDTSMPVYIKGANCSDEGVGGNVVIEAGGPPLGELITGTVGNIELAAQQTTIESNNNMWTFRDDGVLELPEGGDIVDSNGDSVLGSGSAPDFFNLGNSNLTLHPTQIQIGDNLTGYEVGDEGSGIYRIDASSGGGISINDFGEGFGLDNLDKIVTNKLYSTNETQPTQHYRLELDTNGVVHLPDQSIINGATLKSVAGNYAGITAGPVGKDEDSWMWVDSDGAWIATKYNTSAHTWQFTNTGALTLPTNGTIAGLAAATTTSSTAASIGYIGMPQNSKAANYQLVIGDMGKHIYITAPIIVTVPDYMAVDFPVGTTIAIVAGSGYNGGTLSWVTADGGNVTYSSGYLEVSGISEFSTGSALDLFNAIYGGALVPGITATLVEYGDNTVELSLTSSFIFDEFAGGGLGAWKALASVTSGSSNGYTGISLDFHTGATTTINITTDTMYLAGSGTTGTRTLAPYGMATLVKVAQSTWFISGVGLT